MVVGDSVLGIKRETKVFADNAMGAIFDARNHKKYTYTKWTGNKQERSGPEAWRINFSWEYSLKKGHPTVFTDIIRGADKVLQETMNSDALSGKWKNVHPVDSDIRPRMLRSG